MEALPSLLLFDIDGTLVQMASREHATALYSALDTVHGVDARGLRLSLTAAGRTDGEIARALLIASGMPDEEIDAGAAAVASECCRLYRDGELDLRSHVVPGMPELLASLSARDDVLLGLVTGNYELVAEMKLAAAGLLGYFDPWVGAFGSDSEDRFDLPPLARKRAGTLEAYQAGIGDGGPWPASATTIIGDTPRDIACGHADGVRVIAVTTGPYGAAELNAADAIVSDCRQLGAALAG